MQNSRTIQEAVEEHGFAIQDGVLSQQRVSELLQALEEIGTGDAVRKRGSTFAVRNLLDELPTVRSLAASAEIKAIVEPILGSHFFPVRGILFDKIPEANWKVPWHQDLTIAVQEKIEVDGFGPWSVKTGIHHVQPPAYILRNMLTVRLHLDQCNADNGALRVIPGSHRFGRIAEAEIRTVLGRSIERICEVGLGGALVMRPLLLHASSASDSPDHRRVIHLDFARAPLPHGLRWFSTCH